MSYGTLTEVITDSQGFPQDIKFSRPTAIAIYFEVTVTTDAFYPGNGDVLIAENIVEFGTNNYSIGEDVILSQFYTPINAVSGVISIDIKIGVAPSPTGTSNLAIEFDELASYDVSYINVSSS